MAARYRFPIRVKILITFLFVITVVVSLIIIAMAQLFNTDKTTYIRDLTSVMALHTAEETDSLLTGYKHTLELFADVIHDPKLHSKQKAVLIQNLFENFSDFIAVGINEQGQDPVMVYDANTLQPTGLSKEDLLNFQKQQELTVEKIKSVPVYVRNATLKPELPSLLIASPYTLNSSGKTSIITAIVRLDSLLRLARRPSAFEVFIVDSNAELISHANADHIFNHKLVDWIPDIDKLVKQKMLGTTVEFEHNDEPMIGGFASIQNAGLLAGVQIPSAAAYLTARELLNDLLLLSFALLIATALISVFLAHRLTRPLERLTKAAHEVGQGKFDVNVQASSGDEIGVLSNSFNEMASELKQREDELKSTQEALVQSEKMSAFGALSAGIAHEVKNPLAGIQGYAQLCLRSIDDSNPIHENITIIEKETRRCTEIITNLLKFARQEKASFEAIDLNKVVREAMAIVDHQLTINEVKIQMDLEENLPQIMGNPNQLQQVLMNFAINAQQALDGKAGLVRVVTRSKENGKIVISFGDNGPGIPDDVQKKIFEPFFTTKAAGKGTGLGLSVTYGIIKDHKADIKVVSEVGKGTAFVITFPPAEEARDQLESYHDEEVGEVIVLSERTG